MTKDVEAKDADAGINALVEYRVVPAAPKTLFDDVTLTSADGSDEEEDGYGVFEFASPHQPVLTLKAPLDYESVKRYRVIIIASVIFFLFAFNLVLFLEIPLEILMT